MGTPFFNTSGEIEDRNELWGRGKELDEIIESIKNNMEDSPHHQGCMAFFGPAGAGKSSFVKCLFSPEQKRAFYFKPWLNQTELTPDIYQRVGSNSVKSSEELDALLAETIMDALEYVKEVGDEERYASIQSYLQKMDHPSLASIHNILEKLREKAKCHITLICDNFHRLTRNPETFNDVYEHLRSLINDKMLSMILVTDEDFSKLDSRKGETSGSRFSQQFTNRIKVLGLPLDGTKAFIQHRLDTYYKKTAQEDNRISLDEDIQSIHRLSGGLPVLICPVADFFFQLRKEGASIPEPKEVRNKLLTNPRILDWLNQWSQSLDESQRYVLEYFAKNKARDWQDDLSNTKLLAWQDMGTRGLVIQQGKDEETEKYKFVTPLFRGYIRRSQWAAIKPRATVPPAATERTTSIQGTQESAATAPHLHIHLGANSQLALGDILGSSAQKTVYKNSLHQGSIVDDHSQCLTVNQYYYTVIQKLEAIPTKIEAPEFLDLLRSGDSEALTRRMQEVVEPRLDLLDENPEYLKDESIVEAVNSNIGNHLLEEPASEVECEEMEGIFAKIRSDCPEFDFISDVSLSKSCEYFLKAAAVVEHQLQNIRFKDYSHIIFLYGKALEQNLKDEFFEFFKHEEILSQARAMNDKHFKDAMLSETSIGNYEYAIRVKYLAEHCCERKPQGYTMDSEGEWMQWWGDLKRRIKGARHIRNDCDHANGGIDEVGNIGNGHQLVTQKENDEIKKCIFGTPSEEGIIRKSQIGTVLYDMLQQSTDANSHYHRTGMRR